MSSEFQNDIAAILERRHQNGGDFWATEDERIYVGSPFSTLSSLSILHELGVPSSHPVVQGALELILKAWRKDGRIRLAPKAPLYPCYTAEAARILCRFGYANDKRIQTTVSYFLDSAHDTGGWRCSFSRFGRGPETEFANPGATLFILDVFRLSGHVGSSNVVRGAVESLLAHWKSRLPCGPCHYGIGSRFMKVEYPFLRYNLFYYVYVLSFFPAVRTDSRYREAVDTLASKLSPDGRVVVESRHRRLKGFEFCERGKPSKLGTSRYREILNNLEKTA